MGYKLFIDDERFPVEDMVITRNFAETVECMEGLGCPSFISFDHDLGKNEKSGHDIAKWMVEKDMDEEFTFIPYDFTYYIHSQNSVGGPNIAGLLSNYLAHRKPKELLV